MLKTMMAALLCVTFCITGVQAQQSKPLPPPQAPIKSELEAIFSNLVDELRQADALVAHLHDTANKKPEDTQREVDAAAGTLGKLADSLQSNGQMAGELTALRNAAAVHRKRVQDMPKGAIEEEDRTNILSAWDKVIQEADTARTTMGDMHDKLLGALQKLRMRQAAISELMLAGQYQTAVNALMSWLSDLETTVNALHKSIEQAGPVIRGPIS